MNITIDTHDAVAVLHLDDGKKNALGPDAIGAINNALDEAEAKDAGAIVLAGRDGCFSAGFDLNVMRSGDAQAAADMVAAGGRLAHRLYASGLPVVAASTGHAIAAGALLLLASDLRIGAAGDWKIGLNETAIGMTLPGWAIALAEARVERRDFLRLVTAGQLVGPDEAVSAGFLDAVAPGDAVLDQAVAAATQLAALPGAAYAGNKLPVRTATLNAMMLDLA